MLKNFSRLCRRWFALLLIASMVFAVGCPKPTRYKSKTGRSKKSETTDKKKTKRSSSGSTNGSGTTDGSSGVTDGSSGSTDGPMGETSSFDFDPLQPDALHRSVGERIRDVEIVF